MEWIKITDKLPEFGKRVLFRGKITWKTKLNSIDFFDDELTREEETLEYGESAYIFTRSFGLVSFSKPKY